MLEFVVLALATWRIASLLAQEAGPFDVFPRLRKVTGVTYDADGVPHGTGVIAEGITCIWCNSMWVGIVVALAWWLAPDIAFWLALPFALSACAVLIDGVT